MSTNSIHYAILSSLKRHIYDHWHSEIYDSDGTKTEDGYVVPDLEDLLEYEDRDGVVRTFGPAMVTIGRFLEEPLGLAGLNSIPSGRIELHINDQDNPEGWDHTLATEGNNGGYEDGFGAEVRSLYAHELGGGMFRWRRYTADFEIFMVDSDQLREEAYRLGSAALSYLESLLNSAAPHRPHWAWDMLDEDGNTIRDPLGERVLQSVVVKSYAELGGGPESATRGDYIWSGKIYFQVHTS